jgi:hypothetical protein
MAVVIEELQVQTEPAPAPAPAAAGSTPSAPPLDERALNAWIARQHWRAERLAAD